MSRRIFQEIAGLTTEGVHPGSQDLDSLSVTRILQFMSAEDALVAPAVRKVLPQIEKAVEKVLASFQNEGRLIYIGAGTSGRLGIIDASECPPTFGSDPEMVQGIIAGGRDTVFLSREGIEDRRDEGRRDLENINLSTPDTVVGIATSSRTPYVLGALDYAREVGAATIFLMCNPTVADESSQQPADIIIAPIVGPEVIMGSTRLKAGTATKMILNMITTAAFIRMGKVYKGMMVDLKAWSEKLKARSTRVLMLATDLDYEAAEEYLIRAGGSVKTAILMALCKIEKEEAEDLLKQSDGFVRTALAKRSEKGSDKS